MTFLEKLSAAWKNRDSMVCVGLDPDRKKLPACVRGDIFAFNRALIDATAPYACCYKPQAAYYAGQDADGDLAKTVSYIHENHPELPVILDVKRGDIGSTAAMYAREAFERYGADAVTVNPYMGLDALKPFLDYADRGVIILCRTSNPHSGDLQNLIADGKPVWRHVAELARDRWNYNGNVGMVFGATYPEELGEARKICPEMPFLVPGVGAQGGDPAAVSRLGRAASGFGLAVNSSRGIIYASDGLDFAEKAAEAARELRDALR